MLKKVRIKILSMQTEIPAHLFEQGTDTEEALPEAQVVELSLEGVLRDDGDTVFITYREGELSGMGNSKTTISYQKKDKGIVSMHREGDVRTALVFETGKRHICIYGTPVMPFEVAVLTKKVDNALEEKGLLALDYTVELKGANAQRTVFTMDLLPYFDTPFRG